MKGNVGERRDGRALPNCLGGLESVQAFRTHGLVSTAYEPVFQYIMPCPLFTLAGVAVRRAPD